MVLVTIAILIISIILLIIYGNSSFNSKIQSEIDILLNRDAVSNKIISKKDLEPLPELLQNYLLKVNITGKPMEANLVIEQQGRIRKYPSNKWLSFKAKQYMSVTKAEFIWKAKSFPMLVRDKFMDGSGEMKVNFLGIKDIEVAKGSKIDQGSLTRYLAELPIYPNALLDKRIKWKEIDDHSLKATIQAENIIAEGIFNFDTEGWITSFRTKRYMVDSLQEFTGVFENYRDFNGLIIPDELTAIWNMANGDYQYFKCKITSYSLE